MDASNNLIGHKRTIIITGCAGFIGSSLAERLLSENHRVLGLDNFNNFYSPKLKHQNIEEIQNCKNNHLFLFVEGDIRKKSSVDNVFRAALNFSSPDNIILIHLAAMAGVRPSLKKPFLYSDVNIGGTINLLEACKEHKINKHIFASSSSVYGNNKKIPFSEEDPVDCPISVYAATKKSGELICNTYAHLYSIKTIILRFFTVYGPRQRPDLAIHKFTQKIIDNQTISVFGDGKSKRDYTYIDDVVDGVIKAIDRFGNNSSNISELYNLGGGDPIALHLLIEMIERKLRKKAVINWQPDQIGDMKITCADISKSHLILGYTPSTQIEEGLSKFIAWYLEKKKITK